MKIQNINHSIDQSIQSFSHFTTPLVSQWICQSQVAIINTSNLPATLISVLAKRHLDTVLYKPATYRNKTNTSSNLTSVTCPPDSPHLPGIA